MIFGVLNSEKNDIYSSYICPARLYTVASLPWEIQKSYFSTVLFIHTSDYLRYLRRKQTVTPLPTTSEKSPHCLVKCTNFHLFIFVRSVSSTDPPYGRVACMLLRHGLNFSRAWWIMQLISGEKDWERAERGHFEHLL